MSSNIDAALRRHSVAVQEERRQAANDKRRAAGEPEKHCGVNVSVNTDGDNECRKCGAAGF